MTAAEHQRARAIERGGERRQPFAGRQERQRQQREKERQGDKRGATRQMGGEIVGRLRRDAANRRQSDERPAAIAASWASEPGTNETSASAAAAIAARGASAQKLFAMPSTAWAITATAISFSPCNKPAPHQRSAIPAAP